MLDEVPVVPQAIIFPPLLTQTSETTYEVAEEESKLRFASYLCTAFAEPAYTFPQESISKPLLPI